jgi:hypothetical protein
MKSHSERDRTIDPSSSLERNAWSRWLPNCKRGRRSCLSLAYTRASSATATEDI